MEIAASIFGGLFALLSLIAGIFVGDGHHRDLGVWVGCMAAVCACLGSACWYQERLWKKDAEKVVSTTSGSKSHVAQAPPPLPEKAPSKPSDEPAAQPAKAMTVHRPQLSISSPDVVGDGPTRTVKFTISNTGDAFAALN